MNKLIAIVVLLITYPFPLSVSAKPHPSDSKMVPIEAFSQLPDVQQVVLSPNGKLLASAVRVDLPGKKGISVQLTNLETNKSKILLFTDNSRYVIYNIVWKDNVTLMAHGFAPEVLEFRGRSNMYNFKTRVTRVLFVNSNTGEVTKPFTNTFLNGFRSPPISLNNIIDPLHKDPDHVIISVNGTLYKVNIHHGGSNPIPKQPKNYDVYHLDNQDRMRIAYHEDGKTFSVKHYNLTSKKWENLKSFEGAFSEDDIDILGFGEDPNTLYIREYHEGKKAIFKLDLGSPNKFRDLVLKNDKYDLNAWLNYSEKHNKVIGLFGNTPDQSLIFDEKLNKAINKINKALPNTKNRFYSFSEDLDKFLIYSSSYTDSGTYYLATTSPLKVSAVAYRYKGLPPEILSEVKTITYKARDGLEIEAYLTLPRDKPAKNLPTIMLPHGGPISRDTDDFDYWAQFFASRGYAVLQMNFRGSSGYGYEHRQAGLAKWGAEMQEDVEDGAKHLINEGITNPKKIAIVGASYGGYAALMGAAKTPELYQCAISVNGVSDVRKLVLDHRRFWRTYNVVDEQIGTGGAYLKSISPVNHAKKFEAPVLLIHGELDRQVEVGHSERMYKVLKKAKKTAELITLPNEDHYLTYEDNRIRTFRVMASFLEKHMPTH